MKILNKSGIGRSLQILTANLHKLPECCDINQLSVLLANSNLKWKKAVDSYFFEDELSVNSEDESEVLQTNLNINNISESRNITNQNGELPQQRSDGGLLNTL